MVTVRHAADVRPFLGGAKARRVRWPSRAVGTLRRNPPDLEEVVCLLIVHLPARRICSSTRRALAGSTRPFSANGWLRATVRAFVVSWQLVCLGAAAAPAS